jgi:Cu(I)/Ag(I) efflux system membrane fusion protein
VTFYSPQSGVVDELEVREGFYVEPGNTLFSIAQLDNVWVEAEVFERDTALVKEGLAVSMNLDYLPGRDWQGNVDYVYPTLNSETRTLRVRLTFDNPDRQLKPSMFAQINIHADKADPTITVPREAVIRTGNQDRVVLALGEGQFKSVAVDIGRVGNDRIEILNGLNEDDVIVTSAQFLIDSESSKNSDFKRMSKETLPTSAWVEGTINDVTADQRMVNITHGPIDTWKMPGMTMNFEVTDKVDFSQLKPGQTLHFEAIKLDSGMYAINAVHIMSDEHSEMKQHSQHVEMALPEGLSDPAWVEGKINKILADARMISVAHGPIDDWSMPGMTMFFTIADNLNMSSLKEGQMVRFKAYKMAAGYMVTEIASTHAGQDSHDHH